MIPARSAHGRRALLSAVFVVVILAVPTALYLWGRTADSFDVRSVVVTGEERVPRREVQRLLNARFVGENLFTVGAGDVRSTLSRYAYVADVHVDRDFPDTLRIRLTEHEPAALLLSNGTWYVLSNQGTVLAQLDAVEAGKLPVPSASPRAAGQANGPTNGSSGAAGDEDSGGSAGVAPRGDQTDASRPRPSPATTPSHIGTVPVPSRAIVPRGMHLLPLMTTDSASVEVGEPVGDTLVLEGLELLAALPTGLRRDVAAIRVADTTAKADLRDGPVVEFGAVEDLGVKVLALRAVLERYRQRRVSPTFIDVSVPSRPLGSPQLPTPGAP